MRLAALAFLLLPSQEDPLQKLVDQLGSDDYELRVRASAELLKAGEKVRAHLERALKSPDAEVRSRAGQVLKDLERLSFRTSFGLLDGRKGDNRTKLAEQGGGGVQTEKAVLAGLRWLARHQSPDGSWRVQGYTKTCTKACEPNPGYEDFDAGVTGLALLAFAGAGYTHLSKDLHDGIVFGDVVRKALQWMMAQQDREGCIGSRNSMKHMYNHAICTLAMTEAAGLSGSHLFKDSVQKASDFLAAAQNPGKGWRYSTRCGDNDTSVTFWSALALRVAWHAGIQVKSEVFDGARAWLDEVTEEAYGRLGYTHKGTGKVFVPGLNETFDHHEALTAMGVTIRLLLDRNREDPRATSGCHLLLRDKPRWDGNSIDFYYWLAGSAALFQLDGPEGRKWRAWEAELRSSLLPNQNPADAGCKAGSWEPVDRWSGEGGRVYATAACALALETYYRYKAVPRD